MAEEQIIEESEGSENINNSEDEEDTASVDATGKAGTSSDDVGHEKHERKLVIPGEVIIEGDDYLPGDFTKKDGDNIVANRYGLGDIKGRVVKIIPVSGVFEPRRGNTVIGRVEDITFSGWVIDIGGPFSAFLPLAECPRFINKK